MGSAWSLVGGVVLSALAAGTVGAQGFSLAPTIGVYIPTTELVKAASGEEFKQQVNVTVGARLGIPLGSRLGLEASGEYSPSSLRFTSGGTSADTDGNIISGSGRLFLHLLKPNKPLALMVSGGVGVISRGGDAYTNADDKTDVGGVVGASVRFRLGSLLSLSLNAEDYVYKANFTGGALTSEKTQHDVHLSLGFGILGFGMGG